MQCIFIQQYLKEKVLTVKWFSLWDGFSTVESCLIREQTAPCEVLISVLAFVSIPQGLTVKVLNIHTIDVQEGTMHLKYKR